MFIAPLWTICHGYHHDTMYRLTVSAWNWSNLVFNLGGSSFQVCLNLVTGPLIRPITIARTEFMLLKLLQLERERERERERVLFSHTAVLLSPCLTVQPFWWTFWWEQLAWSSLVPYRPPSWPSTEPARPQQQKKQQWEQLYIDNIHCIAISFCHEKIYHLLSLEKFLSRFF